jgi:MFS_1 like family
MSLYLSKAIFHLFLGYGQQRMFGSLAWGGGALITGFLIDTYGMNALFYYTYFFNLVSLTFVVIGLPGTKRAATDTATLVLDSEGIDKDDLMVEEQGGEENPLLSVDANQQLAENMMRRSRSLEGATGDENQNQFQNNLKHDKHSQGRKVVSYMRELYAFMCNPPCRSIIFNSFFYGIVMTIPDTFLFVSLERDFRATRTYSGMVTTASIMACLPLFWFSGPLIARQGHFNLIFLSESSCVLRLLAYSALSPRWSLSLYLLPFIQLIHGFNFALYWSTSVDAIYKLAPPELTTICIAALNISYYTFGGAVGNIVFGHIYDTSGGADAVYRCGGAILIMTLLLLKSQEPIITAALSRHSHSTDSSN